MHWSKLSLSLTWIKGNDNHMTVWGLDLCAIPRLMCSTANLHQHSDLDHWILEPPDYFPCFNNLLPTQKSEWTSETRGRPSNSCTVQDYLLPTVKGKVLSWCIDSHMNIPQPLPTPLMSELNFSFSPQIFLCTIYWPFDVYSICQTWSWVLSCAWHDSVKQHL